MKQKEQMAAQEQKLEELTLKIEDVDMRTETALKFFIKFTDDERQRFR